MASQDDFPRLKQGFATKSSEFAREMGRLGGLKAHDTTKVLKTAHQFTSEEAKRAAAIGLKNRWDKWRAERAEQEAAYIESMRGKIADTPVEPVVSKEQFEELRRKADRLRKQALGKGISSMAKTLLQKVMGERVAELEKELAPVARAEAAKVDIEKELADLDKPLDVQIAEAARELAGKSEGPKMSPREALKARQEAKLEKLRKERKS